jgi:carbon monoxide dehydrogenase subunit G
MQHFEGTVTIKAPRADVWAFLTDPDKVGHCAPGVESVEVLEGGQKFRAIAEVGFGSVKARFSGVGEFLDLDAPNQATLKAHGKAPGSAVDVLSVMTLSDGPDGTTELKWTANITILGTLASLASRMMGSVTKKLSAEFFHCFKKTIEA